jgi:pimeloyl-ACP methyl ester carboxylesterase
VVEESSEDQMKSPIHVERVGAGPRIVFVHGSLGHGSEPFGALRELAEDHTLEFVDRRGFGRSAPREDRVDFDRDADDVAGLLGSGAHLVGHSYGAVVAILATARRPEAVRSLTVIEPPFMSLAADDPAVVEMKHRLEDVFPADAAATPGRWLASFVHALGSEVPDELPVAEHEESDIRASMHERPPWEATVDLGLIRAAGVPVLVIRGDWSPDPAAAPIAGAAFRAIAQAIVDGAAGEMVVVPGATHSPQHDRADVVVPRIRAFIRRAEAARPSSDT